MELERVFLILVLGQNSRELCNGITWRPDAKLAPGQPGLALAPAASPSASGSGSTRATLAYGWGQVCNGENKNHRFPLGRTALLLLFVER